MIGERASNAAVYRVLTVNLFFLKKRNFKRKKKEKLHSASQLLYKVSHLKLTIITTIIILAVKIIFLPLKAEDDCAVWILL